MTQYNNEKFPLYNRIKLYQKHENKLTLYWDLIRNTYNLVRDYNYGVVTDLQTVFLLELCVNLNVEMKKYIGNKVSQKILIKRLESIISLYNDFITHSDDKYISRYMPKVFNVQGHFKLGIVDWAKRYKLYNQSITHQILCEISMISKR